MTLQEFHTELNKLMYIEDPNLVNVTLGSILANSLQVGDPVWLTIIGPSSGGKSQLIRPFAAAHPKYIHRLDDLTPNTLLSGTLGVDNSLLGQIGKAGIISMDDLTVLFSKNPEQRAEILSQFRMLYDGRFSKSSGNRKEPLLWEGYLGMITGSTPSIYRYFSEVADMGERFISYRMKKIDVHKAVEFVSQSGMTSKELNSRIAAVIGEFLPPLLHTMEGKSKPALSPETLQVIRDAAEHCTLLRTPIHIDERSGLVDEFPEPEMPFRVMKQLTYLATGLQAMQPDPSAPLTKEYHDALEWTAYSLANDKRRAYMSAVVGLEYQGKKITTRNVSAATGLHNDIVTRGMSQLQALGILTLSHEEDANRREYTITNREMARFVHRLDPVVVREADLTDL
jgi:hypothetical protein